MLRRFLDTLCGERVGQHLELTSQRVHQKRLVVVGVYEDVPGNERYPDGCLTCCWGRCQPPS